MSVASRNYLKFQPNIDYLNCHSDCHGEFLKDHDYGWISYEYIDIDCMIPHPIGARGIGEDASNVIEYILCPSKRQWMPAYIKSLILLLKVEHLP